MTNLTEEQRAALAALLSEHPYRPDLAPLRELVATSNIIGSGGAYVGFRRVDSASGTLVFAVGSSSSAVRDALGKTGDKRRVALYRSEVRQLRDALTAHLDNA